MPWNCSRLGMESKNPFVYTISHFVHVSVSLLCVAETWIRTQGLLSLSVRWTCKLPPACWVLVARELRKVSSSPRWVLEALVLSVTHRPSPCFLCTQPTAVNSCERMDHLLSVSTRAFGQCTFLNRWSSINIDSACGVFRENKTPWTHKRPPPPTTNTSLASIKCWDSETDWL